jgi:O-antigen ligase
MDTPVTVARNTNAGIVAYSTIATAIVACLLLTNYPTYRYLIYGGFELIWFHLLPGLLMIPMVFAQPSLAFRFVREPLLWWMAIYVLSGLLWLLLAQDFMEAAQIQWRTRLLAFGLFLTISILSSEANRRVLVWVIVGCVLFACATVWFDVLRPYHFVSSTHEYSIPGRGAGFFVNPNVAASFIAAGAIIALPFVPMRFRGALVICAAVGIVPTFSRSGILYAVLILFGAVALRLLNRTQILFVLIVVPLLIAITSASYDFLMSSSDDVNVHNIAKRLNWFGGGTEAEEDQAALGRQYGAAQAWRLFLENPITGNGIGITTLVAVVGEGAHNMYLMLMAEQGFFGMFLYPALIFLIWRRGRELSQTAVDQEGQDIAKALRLYALFLFAYGFFSHNVLDEPQMLFLMAFIAAAAMSARRGYTQERSLVGDFTVSRGSVPAQTRLGRL